MFVFRLFFFFYPLCHSCGVFFCAAGHFNVGCVKKHVSLLTQSIRIQNTQNVDISFTHYPFVERDALWHSIAMGLDILFVFFFRNFMLHTNWTCKIKTNDFTFLSNGSWPACLFVFFFFGLCLLLVEWQFWFCTWIMLSHQ